MKAERKEQKRKGEEPTTKIGGVRRERTGKTEKNKDKKKMKQKNNNDNHWKRRSHQL